MTCLHHTDGSGPPEHFVTPFDRCPEVVLPADGSPLPCPCPGGCAGTMSPSGRNAMDTLTFLDCSVCGCGYVAEDRDQAATLPSVTDLLTPGRLA